MRNGDRDTESYIKPEGAPDNEPKSARRASKEVEEEQFNRYQASYKPQDYSHDRVAPNHYAAKLTRRRIQIFRDFYAGGEVLDLCCGSGDYLALMAAFVDGITGIDFSAEMVCATHQRIESGTLRNAACCIGNARSLPFSSGHFRALYSFSSLYTIPAVEEVLRECARVLTRGGIVMLDFGELRSLNTLVALAQGDRALLHHIDMRRARSMLRESGFVIEAEHACQILPLWGSRPLWLRPLLHPAWHRVLALELAGKTLDEQVCRVLGQFAFRHIVLARKV